MYIFRGDIIIYFRGYNPYVYILGGISLFVNKLKINVNKWYYIVKNAKK
jgi:hypothetical protein